jgi:hypothetical protein
MVLSGRGPVDYLLKSEPVSSIRNQPHEFNIPSCPRSEVDGEDSSTHRLRTERPPLNLELSNHLALYSHMGFILPR